MPKHQPRQQPVLVPEGFPNYLSFRPSAESADAAGQLGATLQQLQQSPPSTTAGLQRALLASIAAFHQWCSVAHADLLRHTHDLAEFLHDSQNDAEAVAAVLEEHDDAVATAFDELSSLIDTVPSDLKPKLQRAFNALSTAWTDVIEAAQGEGEESEEETETEPEDDDADDMFDTSEATTPPAEGLLEEEPTP